jgi:hypothetical protein
MPAPAAAVPPATHTGSPTAATVQRAAVGSVCALLDGLYDAVGGPGKHRAPRRGPRVHADLLGVHATLDADAAAGGPDATVPAPHTSTGSPGRAVSAPRPTVIPRATPTSPAHARRPTATPRGSLLGTVTWLLGLHPRHPRAAESGRPAPRHTLNRPGRPIAPVTPTGPTARGAGTAHPLSALATPARPARVPHARRPGGHRHSGRPTRTGLLRPGPLTVPVPALPRDGRMDHLLRPLLPLHLSIGGPAAGGGARSPWCLPHVGLSLSLGAGRVLPVRRGGPAATQPFRVRTPLLVLTGLTYHGIAAVPTAEGRRRVLVFTAWRVDIASLRQTAPLLAPSCRSAAEPAFRRPPFLGLPGLRLPLLDMGLPGVGRLDPLAGNPWPGCQGTLESDAAPGSTSTARGGPVLLLTRALSGNLLGLLPVTFTPAMPPPLPPGLTVPIPLFFTGVTTFDQYLGADHLSVPGLVQTPALPPAR